MTGLSKIQKITFVVTSVVLFLVIVFYALINLSFAQTQVNGCRVEYKRNLSLGSYGEDVRQLQIFLKNQISEPITGKESTIFGFRLQKMLVDFKNQLYNRNNSEAVLDAQTRALINKTCSQLKAASVTSISSTNTASTNVGNSLEIVLSGPVNFLEGEVLKIKVKANRSITEITSANFIVDGGTVGALRKLARDEYQLSINPSDTAKKIFVQLEAEGASAGGLKNERASNELVIVKLVETQELTNSSTSTSTTTLEILASDFKTVQEFIDYLISLQPKDTAKYFCSTEPYFSIARTIIDISGFDKTKCKTASSEAEKNYPSAISSQTNWGERQIDNNGAYVTSSFDTSVLTPAPAQSVEKYNVLKFMGYLPYVPQTYANGLPVKFDRAILDKVSYGCSKILTFKNGKLYELFETGEKYDFRVKESNDGTFKLLAYPRDAYNYWSKSCFVEEELEPRYFPNGLFCCTSSNCNQKSALEPINYVTANNQLYQVKQAYTTDLSDVYVKNGIPVDTNPPGGLRAGAASLGTTRNECGGYNRPPVNILKQTKNGSSGETERQLPSNDAPFS